MIRYGLVCAQGHEFESWFSSSADFDRLSAAGHVSCAVCGSAEVKKALMAPRLAAGDAVPVSAGDDVEQRPLSRPASAAEQALRELRSRIEATAENVGRDFAREARRIHEGEASARPIIGEARAADARALIEDGIPVAPLPWRSKNHS